MSSPGVDRDHGTADLRGAAARRAAARAAPAPRVVGIDPRRPSPRRSARASIASISPSRPPTGASPRSSRRSGSRWWCTRRSARSRPRRRAGSRARDDRQPARDARLRRGQGEAPGGGLEHDALRAAAGQPELPVREPSTARASPGPLGARPRRDGGAARGLGARDIRTWRSRCCAAPGSSAPSYWSRVVRYFALPVVAAPLGYDPLLQLVHEEDCCAPSSRPRCARIRASSTSSAAACCRSPRCCVWRASARCGCRRRCSTGSRYFPSQSQTGDPPAAFYDYLRYLWVADGRKGWDAFGEPHYSTKEAWISFVSSRRMRRYR